MLLKQLIKWLYQNQWSFKSSKIMGHQYRVPNCSMRKIGIFCDFLAKYTDFLDSIVWFDIIENDNARNLQNRSLNHAVRV